MNNMNDIKNNLANQFSPPSFDEWKEDAQKYLKNKNIEDLISKQLTDKIDIQSIYNKRPSNSLELSFNESEGLPTSSISSNYTLESDLEVAHLLYLVSQAEIDELTVRTKIDSNFFLSIAKFRTLRYLLSNCNLANFNIEAYTTNLNKSIIDESNNIIRLTTEAMSANIGGCDSLDMLPYNFINSILDEQSAKFGSRITQNIKNLLNDESYFDKVTDPLAGSYLIEELTLKFINSAKIYLSELEGLVSEDAVNKYLLEKSKQHIDKTKEQLDSGEKKLIGVNIYQNSESVDPNSDDDRLATDYEKLKAKVDSNKPRVYIANFQEKSKIQLPIAMALNTFNIEFEANSLFELIEDGFNTIKLYDPDLVVVNGDDNIIRNLNNMLSEYSIVSIDEFSSDSMLANINTVIAKMSKVNND